MKITKKFIQIALATICFISLTLMLASCSNDPTSIAKDFLEKIKEGLEDENKFKQSVQELDLETDGEEKETDDEFLEKFLRVVKPGQE